MSTIRQVFACTWVAVMGAMLAPIPGVAAPALLINEIVASNSHGSKDPQGQYEDWIELYNAGTTIVNTAGLYLTDDWDRPTKWRVPTNQPGLTMIPAYGYLLIWADDDLVSTGLHAAFRLSSSGGQLALYDTDGQTLIDSMEFGPQTPNVSYGRDPTAGNVWRFFAVPTPGSVNTGAYLGAVADLIFSHERGFYVEPLTVEIATRTAGASIYYTVDGSLPFDSQRGLPAGQPYTGPISITTTTCLRAIAIRTGWMPTKVVTHTYIFLDDVIRQATDPVTGAQVAPPGYPTIWPGGSFSGAVTGDYQMDPDVVGQNGKDIFGGLYAKTIKDDLQAAPTFSLVMNRDDWFGSKGIYINESQDGTERVGSIEFLDPATNRVVQINCAMAMQGGVTRRRHEPRSVEDVQALDAAPLQAAARRRHLDRRAIPTRLQPVPRFARAADQHLRLRRDFEPFLAPRQRPEPAGHGPVLLGPIHGGPAQRHGWLLAARVPRPRLYQRPVLGPVLYPRAARSRLGGPDVRRPSGRVRRPQAQQQRRRQ